MVPTVVPLSVVIEIWLEVPVVAELLAVIPEPPEVMVSPVDVVTAILPALLALL